MVSTRQSLAAPVRYALDAAAFADAIGVDVRLIVLGVRAHRVTRGGRPARRDRAWPHTTAVAARRMGHDHWMRTSTATPPRRILAPTAGVRRRTETSCSSTRSPASVVE